LPGVACTHPAWSELREFVKSLTGYDYRWATCYGSGGFREWSETYLTMAARAFMKREDPEGDSIKWFLTEALKLVVKVVGSMLPMIGGALDAAWKTISDALGTVMGAVVDFAKAAYGMVVKVVRTVIKALRPVLVAAKAVVKQAGATFSRAAGFILDSFNVMGQAGVEQLNAIISPIEGDLAWHTMSMEPARRMVSDFNEKYRNKVDKYGHQTWGKVAEVSTFTRMACRKTVRDFMSKCAASNKVKFYVKEVVLFVEDRYLPEAAGES